MIKIILRKIMLWCNSIPSQPIYLEHMVELPETRGLVCDTEIEHFFRTCSLFRNETFPCFEAEWEHLPFSLCNAHLQSRWYGLRSMSFSDIDRLPSNTHPNINSAATVDISLLPRFLMSFQRRVCWNCCMFLKEFIYD